VKGRSWWCSGKVRAKTGKLQCSKAANGVGVIRGRQRHAWTWPGGCDGNDRRGGVRSAASLPMQRGKGEEGGDRLGAWLRRRKKGGPSWVGATWRGGVGVRLLHDASAEEAGGGRRSTAAWSGDRDGAWAVSRGRGPVALGRPESTMSFPI
jgi:hypothetical protein